MLVVACHQRQRGRERAYRVGSNDRLDCNCNTTVDNNASKVVKNASKVVKLGFLQAPSIACMLRKLLSERSFVPVAVNYRPCCAGSFGTEYACLQEDDSIITSRPAKVVTIASPKVGAAKTTTTTLLAVRAL